jgi:diguanylate cyclase (GGDEF)-like protein
MSRAQIADLNQTLQHRVDEATTELREANGRLNELARSDHLTRLANRRHFEQTLADLTSGDQVGIGTISLLLVDIDNFKAINDVHGHAVGDMVLVEIGEILNRNTRQTDLAARYAGDEFVLLIRARTDTGRKRAALMRTEIAAHDFHYERSDTGPVNVAVTVSIGIVTFNLADHRDRVDDVLRKVDEAMYSAKRSGRNQVAELSVN